MPEAFANIRRGSAAPPAPLCVAEGRRTPVRRAFKHPPAPQRRRGGLSPSCRRRIRPSGGFFRLSHGRAWSIMSGVASAKPQGGARAAPASTSIWTSNQTAEKRPNGASAPVSNGETCLSVARPRARPRHVSFPRRLAVPSAEASRRRAPSFPFPPMRTSGTVNEGGEGKLFRFP